MRYIVIENCIMSNIPPGYFQSAIHIPHAKGKMQLSARVAYYPSVISTVTLYYRYSSISPGLVWIGSSLG